MQLQLMKYYRSQLFHAGTTSVDLIMLNEFYLPVMDPQL